MTENKPFITWFRWGYLLVTQKNLYSWLLFKIEGNFHLVVIKQKIEWSFQVLLTGHTIWPYDQNHETHQIKNISEHTISNVVLNLSQEKSTRLIPHFVIQILAACLPQDPTTLDLLANIEIVRQDPVSSSNAASHLPCGIWLNHQMLNDGRPDMSAPVHPHIKSYCNFWGALWNSASASRLLFSDPTKSLMDVDF
jgi:hypothetical protein